jgi:transmembrane sensor
MPETLPPHISNLIAAYLSGDISAEGKERLVAWRNEDPSHEKAFQQAEKIWQLELPAPEQQDWNTAAEWTDFLQQVQAPTTETKVVKMVPRRNWWTLGVAASVLLVLAFLLWPKSELPLQQFATLDGEQKEIILPDGSTVWLNENSTISFQEGFEKRNIQLSGEAFFDVKRDTTAPFTIQTGQAVTTVLGTSFNVRAYPTEEKVEVTVATGKVAVSEGKSEIRLTPGNTGIFKKENKELVKKEEGKPHALAWKTGVLDFRNEPLADIIPVLEQLYDIQVDLENPQIGNCRFSGIFENRQPSEIIDVIKYALSLEEESSETPDRIILNGPGCQ